MLICAAKCHAAEAKRDLLSAFSLGEANEAPESALSIELAKHSATSRSATGEVSGSAFWRFPNVKRRTWPASRRGEIAPDPLPRGTIGAKVPWRPGQFSRSHKTGIAEGVSEDRSKAEGPVPPGLGKALCPCLKVLLSPMF